MNELLAAQRHTSDNRAEVEASHLCGCFYCTQTFLASEVIAWGGLDLKAFSDPDAVEGNTALCPKCGSDAVIGDKSGYPIDLDFLSRMHMAWFQQTMIHRPRSKK